MIPVNSIHRLFWGLLLISNISIAQSKFSISLSFPQDKPHQGTLWIFGKDHISSVDVSIVTAQSEYVLGYPKPPMHLTLNTVHKTINITQPSLTYRFTEKPNSVYISNLTSGFAIILAENCWYSFNNCKNSSVVFSSYRPTMNSGFSFAGCKLNMLDISFSVFNRQFYLTSNQIDTLLLTADTVKVPLFFGPMHRPNAIYLTAITFLNDATLDLMSLEDNTVNKLTLLKLSIYDIPKVKFNYAHFKWVFDKNDSRERIEETYKLLINEQNKYGFNDGAEKADIEFQQFENKYAGTWGAFKNWLLPWWNYFGYKKENIFGIAAWAFLGVFSINLFMLIPLIKKGYPLSGFTEAIDKLAQRNLFLKVLLYPTYCLYFTTIVFWGLKLDIDKVRVGNGFALWIFTQYIIGLVLLAFIANVVVGK
jgi:hypothetical protein